MVDLTQLKKLKFLVSDPDRRRKKQSNTLISSDKLSLLLWHHFYYMYNRLLKFFQLLCVEPLCLCPIVACGTVGKSGDLLMSMKLGMYVVLITLKATLSLKTKHSITR